MNYLGVDAVDGVPDILPGGDDHGEGEEDDGGDAPVQAEHWAVDVYVGDFDQGLQAKEYVEHCRRSPLWLLVDVLEGKVDLMLFRRRLSGFCYVKSQSLRFVILSH